MADGGVIKVVLSRSRKIRRIIMLTLRFFRCLRSERRLHDIPVLSCIAKRLEFYIYIYYNLYKNLSRVGFAAVLVYTCGCLTLTNIKHFPC